MVHLTDKKGVFTENATITDIQKALNDLFISKNQRENCVSLGNDSELALDIYQNTIILQDYGRFKYDGPDGPGELLSVRCKEGAIFNKIEGAVDLLEGDEREKLMELLKSLPTPA